MTIAARPARRFALAALAALTLAAAVPGAAGAHPAPPPAGQAGAPDPWPSQPYAFLAGDWDVASEAGGTPVAILRIGWGPHRSYMTFAADELGPAGTRQPHFDGILVWNGVKQALDMLVVLDLVRGLAQEQGEMTAGPDGVVTREITTTYSRGVMTAPGQPATGPEGATARFRQTFTPAGPDRVLTAVLRQTAGGGWAPSFPGSDHLVMTRRGG